LSSTVLNVHDGNLVRGLDLATHFNRQSQVVVDHDWGAGPRGRAVGGSNGASEVLVLKIEGYALIATGVRKRLSTSEQGIFVAQGHEQVEIDVDMVWWRCHCAGSRGRGRDVACLAPDWGRNR